MLDNLNYTGAIKITKISNDHKLSTKIFNHGENALFALYAKALTGLDITNELPRYINFRPGYKKTPDSPETPDSRNSLLISNGLDVTLSLVTDEEVNNPQDTGIGKNVPCTRISATLISSIISKNNVPTDNTTVYITLEDKNKQLLAYAETPNDLKSTLRNLNPGTQILIVWDLYITNPKQS